MPSTAYTPLNVEMVTKLVDGTRIRVYEPLGAPFDFIFNKFDGKFILGRHVEQPESHSLFVVNEEGKFTMVNPESGWNNVEVLVKKDAKVKPDLLSVATVKTKPKKLKSPSSILARISDYVDSLSKRFQLEMIITSGDVKKCTYVFAVPDTMILVYSLRIEVSGRYLIINDGNPVNWTKELAQVTELLEKKIPNEIKTCVQSLSQ